MLHRRFGFLIAILLLSALLGNALAQVFIGPPPSDWQGASLLEWVIFDTNEGDAMLLRCGEEVMMVDGGPAPFRENLRTALEAHGLTRMKYILSTHAHDDHIDGLYHLFSSGFTAEKYIHPYNDVQVRKDWRLQRTVKAAKRMGAQIRRTYSGDTLTLGQAEIQVFRCMAIENANAKSLVLKIQFGNSSLLLCADITGKAQRWYCENLPEGTLRADLIKMPHHDLTPAVPQFFSAVSPQAAIVTNTSDKPSFNCANQFIFANIPAFYSGDGSVYCVTDGNDWYIQQVLGSFDAMPY